MIGFYYQVAVSTDSQEALCSDGGESSELECGLSGSPSIPLLHPSPTPPSPCSHHRQPALCLVPATPVRPHQQEEASVDQEVSLITCVGLAGSDDVMAEDSGDFNEGYSSYAGCQESRSPYLRQLKRFHSADTQGRSTLLPRPRRSSWLDDPRPLHKSFTALPSV
ncbi:voltage-dependent T-type calcium channel subunit alpha-1G [Lates japonicus]|uniref:Voltage-dependent T-type calcium channel subunit alpha-1G n=1 Tax=Lates japonicus TaxID=270547 RepID=A0AAD3ME54_LATJO|nr:voltage-dependent T-type calcium channel subunit alpha-1G [Lates japonicus]